ncbi:MAG: DUF4430 domain-containing protein [Lachnospiraceae bacterium]|nr:DUF4430 domain-containing protein [Lachnospiraceae bacterium]
MSETAKQGNGKKIAIAVVILAVLAVAFGLIYMKFAPKAQKGAKELSIEVVDNKEKSKKYTVHTDAKYLRQALEETEGLTIEGTESEYGLMVQSVNGIKADYDTNGAYWSFYLNGEYCNYGIDQQPVKDGESYKIVYTTGE